MVHQPIDREALMHLTPAATARRDREGDDPLGALVVSEWAT